MRGMERGMPPEGVEARLEAELLWDPAGRGCAALAVPGDLGAAARALLAARRVAIVTGLYVPAAGAPETDGPPGSLALARALGRLGKSVVLVTDRLCAGLLQAAAKAGWGAWPVLFRGDGADGGAADGDGRPEGLLEEVLDGFEPDHLVAVERLGRAADGRYYNARGEDVTAWTPALDGLFLMMAEEERAIRRDPLGQGSRLLRKVFGAIR